MMRKCPVRFGGGPVEKAETSDLACGLPYPASSRSSDLAFGIQTYSCPTPQPVMRTRFLEGSCIIMTPSRRSFWEGDM